MQHEVFREWLTLSVYRELDSDQEEQLRQHVQGCEPCRSELRELHKMISALDELDHVSEDFLFAARSGLKASLPVATPDRWTSARQAPWSMPLAAAASLLLGLSIGYLVSMGRQTGSGAAGIIDSLSDPDVGLVSVEFLDADSTDGEIELAVEASLPLRLKGAVGDPGILQVLSRTLAANPSTADRLQAVYTFDGLSRPSSVPRARALLMQSMKYDSSVAVRRGAMGVLQTLPYNREVHNALLHVVVNDPNPAMRIAALGALQTSSQPHSDFDAGVIEDLEARLDSEENNFIRLQSRALLEQVRENR